MTFFELFLIVIGLKYALSIKIDVVEFETPELKPPIIPANAIGLSLSAITKFSSYRVCVFSSKVIKTSSFFAFLIKYHFH